MFRSKKIFKVIGGVVLGLGILGGAFAITSHFIKKDEVAIHPTFEVGGLNAVGKYEEDTSSLYTNKKFACEGMKVTLEFDSTINYQVYYYDILDNYLSSTEVLDTGYSGEIPLNGAYARVKLTPTNDDDGKISWKEKIKYSKMINITVSKKADSNVSQKFVSYKGNCFQVVNNIKDSVFVYGYKFDNGEIVDGKNFAATTKTILAVKGGEKIAFDKTKLGENGMYCVYLYQFNELPTDDSKYTQCNLANPDYTNELKKDTKYIIISAWGDDTSSFATNYEKLIDAISFTK